MARPATSVVTGRRSSALVAGAALALLLVLAVLAGCADRRAGVEWRESGEPATYDYLIPAGTAARAAAGRPVDVVPQHLDVKVGETIRVRNQDSVGAEVGVFFVGPGETVSMKFTKAGVLRGKCTIHRSGEFTINVT
jgi:plastocyanin